MENYEQKYKEALKVIKSLYNVVRYQSSTDALFTLQTIEKTFPELKESEDEKIRKGLIGHLKELKEQSVDGPYLKRSEHYDAWIAWLEKQGEQKPADKVDVLMSLDEAIEHCKEKSCGNNACALEHKQLEKWLTELKELKEQKSAWSEDDEEMRLDTIKAFQLAYPYDTEEENPRKRNIDWLKSLKPYWKPTKEQMGALRSLLSGSFSMDNSKTYQSIESLYNDLKSL